MKSKTDLSALAQYNKRVNLLKRWVELNDSNMAEGIYLNHNHDENLLQLALQYRDLSTIDYLLSANMLNIGANIFNQKTMIDEKTWKSINTCLREEEEYFAGYHNYGFFHQNLIALVHKRLEFEFQKKLVNQYGVLGFVFAPIAILIIFLWSPHVLKLIGNGVQSSLYTLRAIRSKFFSKSMHKKEEEILTQEELFKERYPTSEINKAKAKINKRTNRLYNYTSLGYALAATALTVVVYYGAPALVKVGQTVISSVLSFGLMAISGALLAGAELWMARSYQLKVREDERSFQVDLHKINQQIINAKEAPQSLEQAKKILILEHQKTELTSYYQTQILSNQRLRNAAIVGATFFALASIASFIPVLAPFTIPIIAISVGGWLAAKLVVMYQNYKMNEVEQIKLTAARKVLETDCTKLENQFAATKQVVPLNEEELVKSSQIEPVLTVNKSPPVNRLQGENKNLFFSTREDTSNPFELDSEVSSPKEKI